MANAICAASPWPLGGNLGQFDVAVFLDDGIHPVDAMVGEVLRAKYPAVVARGVFHALGENTAIESLPVAVRDQRQRLGEIGVDEHVTRGGCPAVGQEMCLEVRIVGVGFAGSGPDRGSLVADVEAVPGIANRGVEQFAEGQCAETP